MRLTGYILWPLSGVTVVLEMRHSIDDRLSAGSHAVGHMDSTVHAEGHEKADPCFNCTLNTSNIGTVRCAIGLSSVRVQCHVSNDKPI